jgi:hypothetical protein
MVDIRCHYYQYWPLILSTSLPIRVPQKNSRQWARLRILCYAGLDLMTIIQDAFGLVRELCRSRPARRWWPWGSVCWG